MTLPRCNLQLRPSALRRSGPALVGPGLEGHRPEPKSRRSNAAYAATVTSAVNATSSSSGHQRSPEYACIPWYQPIGDSQDRPPPLTSPTARNAYATPITPPVIPSAARVL